MNNSTDGEQFYVAGGTLRPDTPSYVERRADQELYERVSAGQLCYVLTPRQMGKSSLMARTARRLAAGRIRTAIVDLSQIGSEKGKQNAASWYYAVCTSVHRGLQLQAPLKPWWEERAELPPTARFAAFLRDFALIERPEPVVVFVDEIDSTIGLPFADDFFAAIRACHNARATDPAYERLTFVLLGVATPNQLIRDPTRTPFNIGQRIELADFTRAEASALAQELGPDGEALLTEILSWTGGHPYLTQAVCRELAKTAEEDRSVPARVGECVDRLFLARGARREEVNLKYVRARILQGTSSEIRARLLLYGRVRRGEQVPDDPTSPVTASLKLTGILAVDDNGQLRVRNRIYREVFDEDWIQNHLPAANYRAAAVGVLGTSAAALLLWYFVLWPRQYVRNLETALQDYPIAIESYQKLRAHPLYRWRANEMFAQFWDRRARWAAAQADRDRSLLCLLTALTFEDTARRRREAAELIGHDYGFLVGTMRHAAAVSAAAFSPDGQSVVTGSYDETARLWRADSGSPMTAPMEQVRGHAPPTGQEQSPSLGSVPDPVLTLAFGAGGLELFTAGASGRLYRWRVPSGERMEVSTISPEEPISNLTYSSSTQKVVTAGQHRILVWSAAPILQIHGRAMERPPAFISALAVRNDGAAILASDYDGNVQLWDAARGTLRRQFRQMHGRPGPGKLFAFSRHGDLIAEVDNALSRAWISRVDTAELVGSFEYWGRAATVAAIRPDDEAVALGMYDGSVQTWRISTGEPLGRILLHGSRITALAFAQDGRAVLAGSMDGTARLWRPDAARTNTEPGFPVGNNEDVVALSPDGNTLLMGTGTAAFLRSAQSGTAIGQPLRHGEYGGVLDAAFSPDGSTVVIGHSKGAYLWNADTGEFIRRTLHPRSIREVAFSPDGKQILAGSSDGTALVLDGNTLDPIHSRSQASSSEIERDPVVAVAFAPDSTTFAVVSAYHVRVWRKGAKKPMERKLSIDNRAVATFSPDGESLAVGSGNATHLLPLDGSPHSSHVAKGQVDAVAFTGDGKLLVTVSGRWLTASPIPNTDLGPPRAVRWLPGYLPSGGGMRRSDTCTTCFQLALVDARGRIRIHDTNVEEPSASPLEGEPRSLLETWQRRLGLRLDDHGELTPPYPVPVRNTGERKSGGSGGPW